MVSPPGALRGDDYLGFLSLPLLHVPLREISSIEAYITAMIHDTQQLCNSYSSYLSNSHFISCAMIFLAPQARLKDDGCVTVQSEGWLHYHLSRGSFPVLMKFYSKAEFLPRSGRPLCTRTSIFLVSTFRISKQHKSG